MYKREVINKEQYNVRG